MFNLVKDEFDETPEDIMDSINRLLDETEEDNENKEEK